MSNRSAIDTRPSISATALERAYDYLGTPDSYDSIHIYKKKNNFGFIAGVRDDTSLKHFLDIKTRHHSYPVQPVDLLDPYFQVSFVIVSEEFAEQSYTKAVYKFLVSMYDIVSDHEQYLGGKRLWQSIAKDKDVFVYVFDGNKDDYIRDEHGVIIRYDNDDIHETKIWGPSIEHSTILLVASRKEKK